MIKVKRNDNQEFIKFDMVFHCAPTSFDFSEVREFVNIPATKYRHNGYIYNMLIEPLVSNSGSWVSINGEFFVFFLGIEPWEKKEKDFLYNALRLKKVYEKN